MGCGRIDRGAPGVSWGWQEFATADWYTRRCAAEGSFRGEISNVTDPVMMLHAGSISE